MCGKLCICFSCQSCREPQNDVDEDPCLGAETPWCRNKTPRSHSWRYFGQKTYFGCFRCGKKQERFNVQHLNDFHTCGSWTFACKRFRSHHIFGLIGGDNFLSEPSKISAVCTSDMSVPHSKTIFSEARSTYAQIYMNTTKPQTTIRDNNMLAWFSYCYYSKMCFEVQLSTVNRSLC